MQRREKEEERRVCGKQAFSFSGSEGFFKKNKKTKNPYHSYWSQREPPSPPLPPVPPSTAVRENDVHTDIHRPLRWVSTEAAALNGRLTPLTHLPTTPTSRPRRTFGRENRVAVVRVAFKAPPLPPSRSASGRCPLCFHDTPSMHLGRDGVVQKDR